MPRNASGVYSLPNPPRVPNTVIYSLDENQTRDDIAAALTDSLDRYGRGPMLAPMRFGDGSAAVPSISWTNETNSGWYRAGLNDFRFAINGVDVLTVTDDGLELPVGTTILFPDGTEALPSITFASDPTSGWYKAGADDFRFSVGGVDTLQISNNGTTFLLPHWGGLQVESTSGTYIRFHDSSGPVDARRYNLQFNNPFWTWGPLPDDETVFHSYMAWDGDGDEIRFWTPGTFSIRDTLNSVPLLLVSAASAFMSLQAGRMSITNTNDTTQYNSSMLSLNATTPVGFTGLTVHNTAGAGAGMVAATFMWANAVVGSIGFTGAATTYNTASDRRLKEDVRPLTSVGDLIDRLEPVRFKWKQLDQEGVGFIAQDVIKVVPEAVMAPTIDPESPWQMDASRLMPYVIAELKALRNRVDALEG